MKNKTEADTGNTHTHTLVADCVYVSADGPAGNEKLNDGGRNKEKDEDVWTDFYILKFNILFEKLEATSNVASFKSSQMNLDMKGRKGP